MLHLVVTGMVLAFVAWLAIREKSGWFTAAVFVGAPTALFYEFDRSDDVVHWIVSAIGGALTLACYMKHMSRNA